MNHKGNFIQKVPNYVGAKYGKIGHFFNNLQVTFWPIISVATGGLADPISRYIGIGRTLECWLDQKLIFKPLI